MSGRITVPPDTLEAQATASAPRSSAWVSANAGSGKTHVLAQRVMRLLLEGVEPSRILCLTYTRAAAANMANRVFGNLARWATLPEAELAAAIGELGGDPPDRAKLKLARQLFALALETPGGLKIQTIHAFCEAVLHQFPLEANIAGHFELLDSGMETALLAETRREMIAGAAGDGALREAFATVIDLGGETGLEALLAAIIRQREALRRFIDAIGDGDDRFRALFEEFGYSGAETKAGIAAGAWPDSYFTLGLARDIEAKALAADKQRAGEFAAGLAAAAALVEPVERLDALVPLFLKGKPGRREIKTARTIMSKGVGQFFPGFDVEFERFAKLLDAAADRIALFAMLEASRAALVVADWFIGRYERLKSARGFLDFNDLINRTAWLLARQDAGPWVQYKLDKGIDHILLDEAQDTSPGQWAVVQSLAAEFFAGEGAHRGKPRTIFAVGDEKQSIYSFQGAEPDAFARSGREFGSRIVAAEGRFEHVRLKRSFRSTDDVLSAVDLVFASERNRDGLTVDPEPIGHLGIRVGAPGHVEVWPALAPEAVEEPDDWTEAIDHASAPAVRLAKRIALTISGWLKSGEMIPGAGRRLTAGDVMVLVRKRDRFIHALSRELKNLNVPVAGADRLLLTDHIAVQDLMAIARVALQPDDDLSLAALLKSPAFGFSEAELFDLAAGRPGSRSLLASLEANAGASLWCDAAWRRIVLWRNEAGYRPPFEFFGAILARDGLRRDFVARLGVEAGDIVDEFLNFCLAAEKTGTTSLEALIALLDAGAPEIKREMDQTRGEVRIMTVHAAKGLEAPVVFLVDGGSAAFDENHLPRLMPFDAPNGGWTGKGFLWRANADMTSTFSRKLAGEARAKAEQEYRRLLYVGMTRAEDRLIVCGYHGVRGQPDDVWHRMVSDALASSEAAREVVDPASGETILRYSVTPAHEIEIAEAAPASSPVAPTLPAALSTPLPAAPRLPRPLSPSGTSLVVEPDAHVTRLARSPVLEPDGEPSAAMQRGTAAHRLLQVLPGLEQADRAEAAQRYLDRVGASWPQAERTALAASLARILDDAGFAPIFGSGSRAEVSIMGSVPVGGVERAVSGKIDRLVVTADDVLIVDYKTNRPPPGSIDEVPDHHVAQMALYRALVSRIYADRPVRAALVYTELPALIAVPNERMDAALARLGAS